MPRQKKCNPTFPVGYPFHISQKGYGSITGIGVDTQAAPDRAKPGAFKTAEFFAFGKNSFQLSYLEISKTQGVQELTAKKRIQSDIENGYITKERTTYKSPKYKALLDGRNIYHLTQKGRKELNISRNIPQSINSSKEEFAKSIAPESSFSKFNSGQQLLQKHGCAKLVEVAPTWWFKDSQVLEKTLKLLNQKQGKGYKVQNSLRWISSVLKQEAMGYRERIAKETAEKLRGELPAQTPFEETVLKALQSLQTKGLDTSPSSLQPLLRKGLSHLKIAITVLEKYIEWNKPIKSLNGILAWLVGQKDPLELLKPIAHSTEKQITKLKIFFTHNASHFTFGQPTCESSKEKPHIQLLIHSKSLNASIVKLYKKIQGEWKCLTLEVGKTTGNFYDLVLLNIQKHFGGQYVIGN
jgi:hypothetical protein